MAENLNSLAASIADTKQLYGKKVTDAQDFLDYAQRNSININLWDEGYDGIADANNVTSQRMFAKDSMLFLELKGANGQDGQMVCIDLSASTLTPTVVSEQDIENMFIEKNGLSGILNINDAIEDVDIGKNDLINPKINLNKINLDNASGLTAADELITTLISKGFVDKTSYSSALNSIKSIFGNHSESSIISENETTGIIEIKVVRDGEAFVATYDTKNSDDPVSVKQLSINDFAVDGKINGIKTDYIANTSNCRIENNTIACDISLLQLDQNKINTIPQNDLLSLVKFGANQTDAMSSLQALFGSNATITQDPNGKIQVNLVKNGAPYNIVIKQINASNPDISLNLGGPTSQKITTYATGTNLSAPNVTISAQDIQKLKEDIAAAGNNLAAQKNVVARYLLDNFGNDGNTAINRGAFGTANYKYTGDTVADSNATRNSVSSSVKMENGIVSTNGTINLDNYKDMMDVLVSFSGLTFNTGNTWGVQDRVNARVNSFYLIVQKVLNQVNSATSQTDPNGVQINNAATFNISDIRNNFFTDPIGFESDGKRYDFVEDENNDNVFNNSNELIGADNGFADLTKYDDNNDGIIDNEELEDLKVLVQNEQTGEHEIVSAKKAGISKIDLSSFQKKDEIDENGNLLAGEFKLVFNNKEITGSQTYDSEEYLKEHYKDEEGLNFDA